MSLKAKSDGRWFVRDTKRLIGSLREGVLFYVCLREHYACPCGVALSIMI